MTVLESSDVALNELLESDGATHPPNPRIVFFGHDLNESTIRKRANEFLSLGSKVTGFMFSRRREKRRAEPGWQNFELGLTDDGYYGRRIIQLCSALGVLWRNRRVLRDADVLYARNIDMLALAAAGKLLVRAKAPIAYEALDVHPAFTETGLKARLLRFAERRLLARSSLLIVSSPVFIDRYFRPVQNYKGPHFLLENKLGSAAGELINSRSSRSAPIAPPWIIGWFGVIRCQRSIEILTKLASELPQSVIVHIRGLPSERDGITDDLLKELSTKFANIKYFGAYQSPRDLVEIYSTIHLAWAVDFSASGANSDWLIPNRLYEGGINGVPAVARRGTATGDIVERRSIGWCLEEPFESNLATFIATLDCDTYSRASAHILSMDRSAFVDVADTRQLLKKLGEIARRVS
jgi:succinoglycan biosynthesis protein ExoL